MVNSQTLITDPVSVLPEGALPMTESQKGLLVIDRLTPTPQIYNVIAEIGLDPGLSETRVRAALATVVAVQPALRLVFAELPTPHAVLTEPPGPQELAFEYTDLPEDAIGTGILDAVRRLGAYHFPLTTGPLYRFAHLRSAEHAALVIVVHHTVFDGFSLSPLLADLENVFADPATGPAVERLRNAREHSLARELSAQARIATDEATLHRARAWAEQLRELPATTLYPHPERPAETRFAGTRIEQPIDEGADIQAACRRLAVNPFVFFTAVYAAVLARHSASSRVVVGSPIMARRTVGAFELSGFFVNSLPIVIDVDWKTTFDTYAGQTVRAATDHARSHVDVAFNQLVQHVRPDRSTDRNAIFSCMLAMQAGFVPSGTGVIRSVREHGNGTAKFDLWLGVTPVGDGWLLEIEYDEELIPQRIAGAFAESLRTALHRAAAAGDSTCLADLFEDASRQESYASDGYPQGTPAGSLAEWVHQAALARPDAPAIEEAGRTIGHGELATAADEVAAGLSRLGVRGGDVVGLHMNGLGDTAIAIMAILRCGAAYLPLDAELPVDRLRYAMDKAGCWLVVGDAPFPGVRTVTLADARELAHGATRPDIADLGAWPAYVMFTSGSTGRPKGVQMGQEPLLNLTSWQLAALEMDAGTRFLQYAPLGFDVSFQEIIPTLIAGGTVVSREPVDRRDFPALADHVAATEVTHLYLPVAALRPFVQAAGRLRLERLRYLCVSGEQLAIDEQVRDFFAARPHCLLINLYGPTETHAVTTQRLSAGEPHWPRHVPIGRPITGVAAYVVDVTGHLAPPGVAGELLLGGRCPAKGYINDPERTAPSFLADRFAGHGIMYRTGDQVMRDENGLLIFLGRDDRQIKIRGYRVELGELEVATDGFPGVRQALAAVRGSGADRELVLFIQADNVAPDRLRDRLREVLPAYMVPTWIFPVDSVPITANGKVDRAALLTIAEEQITSVATIESEAEPEYHDDLERELAGLWAELLTTTTPIAPDRSVLEYGAHSLTVFTALARVEQDYGVRVRIARFFRSPTITALAAAIRAGQDGSAGR